MERINLFRSITRWAAARESVTGRCPERRRFRSSARVTACHKSVLSVVAPAQQARGVPLRDRARGLDVE
jgi:hypothetical protein